MHTPRALMLTLTLALAPACVTGDDRMSTNEPDAGPDIHDSHIMGMWFLEFPGEPCVPYVKGIGFDISSTHGVRWGLHEFYEADLTLTFEGALLTLTDSRVNEELRLTLIDDGEHASVTGTWRVVEGGIEWCEMPLALDAERVRP